MWFFEERRTRRTRRDQDRKRDETRDERETRETATTAGDVPQTFRVLSSLSLSRTGLSGFPNGITNTIVSNQQQVKFTPFCITASNTYGFNYVLYMYLKFMHFE